MKNKREKKESKGHSLLQAQIGQPKDTANGQSIKKNTCSALRWVQVTPNVTLVKLHIFYTANL